MSSQTPLPVDSILIGPRGSYHITSLIDRGGFGITYRAETIDGAPGVPSLVAVKEFFPKDMCQRDPGRSELIISDPSQITMIGRLRDRFVKESRNLAACDIPSVVRVIDTIEANGTAYMVMELVDGKTLKEVMHERGDRPLDVDTARRLIIEAAEALDYLHSKRINHLDIKPGNLMVSPDLSRLVVIDFGLSRQYKADGSSDSEIVAAVSKGFASPEQYAGVTRFSPESDVYSLGATYYKLLTGETPPEPFDLADDPSLLTFPASVPDRDRRAIVAAMKPDRRERLSSAAAFIGHLKGSALPPPLPPPFDDDDNGDDGASVFGILLNILSVALLALSGYVLFEVLVNRIGRIAYEFGFSADTYEVSSEGLLVCMGIGILCSLFSLFTRRLGVKFFWFICAAGLIGSQAYYAL